jgi:hypothetical protein
MVLSWTIWSLRSATCSSRSVIFVCGCGVRRVRLHGGFGKGDKDGYLVVELVFGFEDGWQLWQLWPGDLGCHGADEMGCRRRGKSQRYSLLTMNVVALD